MSNTWVCMLLRKDHHCARHLVLNVSSWLFRILPDVWRTIIASRLFARGLSVSVRTGRSLTFLFIYALAMLAVAAPVAAQSDSEKVDTYKALDLAAAKVRKLVVDSVLVKDVLGLDIDDKSKPTVVKLPAPKLERVSKDIAKATYSKEGADFVVTLKRQFPSQVRDTASEKTDGFIRMGTGTVLGFPVDLRMKMPTTSGQPAHTQAITHKLGFEVTVEVQHNPTSKSSKPDSNSKKSNPVIPGDAEADVGSGVGGAFVGGLGDGLGDAFFVMLMPPLTAGLVVEFHKALDFGASDEEEDLECPKSLTLSGTTFALNPRKFTRSSISHDGDWRIIRCGYADPKYDDSEIVDVEITLKWLTRDIRTSPLGSSDAETFCGGRIAPSVPAARDVREVYERVLSWTYEHTAKTIRVTMELKSEHFSQLFERKYDYLFNRTDRDKLDHVSRFLNVLEFPLEITRILQWGNDLWVYPQVPDKDVEELSQKFIALPQNAVSCAPYLPKPSDFKKCAEQVSNAEAKGFSSGVVGVLAGRFRKITIKGCRGEFEARRGALLFLGDHVVTGPKGRARIIFNDRIDAIKSGPSVMNIGPNSDVLIKEMYRRYKTRVGKVLGKEPDNIVEALYGNVLLFFRGPPGSKWSFRVEAGVAICGIRGSEGMVSYNPDKEHVTAYLNEGHMDVTGASGQATELIPGKYVELERGSVGQTRAFTPANWTELTSNIRIKKADTERTRVAEAVPVPAVPENTNDTTIKNDSVDSPAVDQTKKIETDPSNTGNGPINSTDKSAEKNDDAKTSVQPSAEIRDSDKNFESKSSEIELEFWRAVKDSKDPAELEAYLEQFPSGKFTPLARIRLKKMSGGKAGSVRTGKSAVVSDPAKSGEIELIVKLGQFGGPDQLVKRGWLGVRIQDVGHTLANAFTLKNSEGSLIAGVNPDSPAEKAGLRAGDIILSLDGNSVADSKALAKMVGAYVPGTEIRMLIWRIGADRNEVVASIRDSANSGNADAMYLLGSWYDEPEGFIVGKNLGISKDSFEAARWYRKAAENGHALAMNNLGNAYKSGEGVPKDYQKAIYWYKKAAEKDRSAAMLNLGYVYQAGGVGLSKDLNEAVFWFRKAADKGNAFAMNELGLLYENDEGSRQDITQAIKWYRKSAEQNFTGAIFNIARLHDAGKGLEKDPRQAAELIVKLLKRKHYRSMDIMKNGAKDWSPAFRRELQRLMKNEGVYDGVIDGKFGFATERAVMDLYSKGGK